MRVFVAVPLFPHRGAVNPSPALHGVFEEGGGARRVGAEAARRQDPQGGHEPPRHELPRHRGLRRRRPPVPRRVRHPTYPDIDLATITNRMEVKKAVQSGNVQEAIEKINDLNPTILDTNPQLYFHLQQQKLIELIRVGKIHEALEFAQEELAPRGEENQAFLEEIEKTVALMVFEDVKNCPYGELLNVSQRLKTASEVNAAILTSQSHEKDPKLPSLLKMLIWTQNELSEKAAYPRINNLSTADLEDPAI